ncbi:MAG: DNA primase [Candidatus Pelagadaptatus aseana]|uniref:DNA primase n=1 Tax=Candidatus Pelagadaptatus aseana TaxID=3120508 RepID=UPI0039B246B1
MAGRIPQTFIDDLLDRVDIVDVVDARVKLKKTGKNYSACCPFHDEKTPSFTVSPDKQFYYCFGCGASGTALGFVLDFDRTSFPEAVETLARSVGMEVPREQHSDRDNKAQKQRRNLYQLLEKADQHYQQQLRHSPAKQHAINYLKQRGLSGEIARDFGIGYAPPGWDNLLKALGLEEHDKSQLTESGMIIEREEDNKRYDRFRNRIMFPIRDVRGRVIGFGGRVLDDSKPKYLNSPETPIFHKGKELYGLYEAKQANRQLDRILVVEGYMDVVALAQFGIRNAVATLGTACGEDHLTLSFKHTSEVVFCFDGDNAGRNAASRALENALPTMQDGRRIKFLFLPDGEDPDTLVRQIGPETFNQMIDQAVPLEEFLFDSVSSDINLQTMEGRAQLSKMAAPLLHKLPQGVYKELMFTNLAQRTGISTETLMELVEAPAPPARPAQTPRPAPTRAPAPPPQPAGQQPAVQQPATHRPPENPAAAEPFQPDSASEAPPEYPQDMGYYEHHGQTASEQPQLPPARYKGPVHLPAQKLVSILLLHHPSLASLTPELPHIQQSPDPDLQLFCELLTLLKQRPQYTQQQILGHWIGTRPKADVLQLEQLTNTELISQASQYEQFSGREEYIHTLNKLEADLKRQKHREILEKLTHKNFNELSDEEKQLLKDGAQQK